MADADEIQPDWTDDWGIDHRYVDAFDTEQDVAPEVIAKLREIVGTPPPDLADTAPVVTRRGADISATVGSAPLSVRCEDGTDSTFSGAIPDDFPYGYHRLADGRSLIVSPGRCWLPDAQAWGWTVQLYAVRSAESWGFGDLGDLARLRDWAARQGAGFLLVNPLHAVAPGHPQEDSPYLPASRRFRNPLYLRIADVSGADSLTTESAEQAGRVLSDLAEIDRDAVWDAKRTALQAIFETTAAGNDADFRSWRQAQGTSLEQFATWCSLAERHGHDFREWPGDLQRPDSPAVTAHAEAAATNVSFHAWLQWLVEFQLIAATESMTVLQDLPIGVHGGGADAWAWQDTLAGPVRIGAPPDLLNRQGQNWGSPPLIPWRLRAAEYEPFIDSIRSTMAATGGLRIDHVMGLFRLWWLLADDGPTEGAYVRYPSADLLNIVALESHRAQALVVGEDLGTVEPGVRETLAEHAILSYKLLIFEPDAPSTWAPTTMAAITTHDLPTVAGLYSGDDLTEQLGYLEADPAFTGSAELRAGASQLLQQIRGADAEPGEPQSADTAARIVAAHARLGQAPSLLLSATLEDAVAAQRRPNMPGIDARPNWRLPMPVRLEELIGSGPAERIAEVLNAAVEPGGPV